MEPQAPASGVPAAGTTVSAPSAPVPAPSASGVSSAGAVGQPAASGGSSNQPNQTSFRETLNAAAGLPTGQEPSQGQASAAGQAGTNMLGQPLGGQPAAQQPATIEALLAQHPQLMAQFNEAMQWSQYGQQQWVTQQQQRQGAGQQQRQGAGQQGDTPKNIWGIPDFDQRLLSWVQRDPSTGRLVTLPGAPPGLAVEAQQWLDARDAAYEQMLTDPMKVLGPAIKQMISQHATEGARGEIANVQNKAFVDQYIASNAHWMYQVDPTTKRMTRDIFGRPQMTAAGQAFFKQCEQLEAMGIRDPQIMQQMAEDMVFGRLAMSRLTQQQQATQQHQAGNQALLNSGQGGAMAGGPATGASFNPHAPGTETFANDRPTTPGSFNLRNMMLQAAQANGVDINGQL